MRVWCISPVTIGMRANLMHTCICIVLLALNYCFCHRKTSKLGCHLGLCHPHSTSIRPVFGFLLAFDHEIGISPMPLTCGPLLKKHLQLIRTPVGTLACAAHLNRSGLASGPAGSFLAGVVDSHRSWYYWPNQWRKSTGPYIVSCSWRYGWEERMGLLYIWNFLC